MTIQKSGLETLFPVFIAMSLQTSHLPGRTEFITKIEFVTKRLSLDLGRFLYCKLYVPDKIVSAISHFLELLRNENGLIEATSGEENEGAE